MDGKCWMWMIKYAKRDYRHKQTARECVCVCVCVCARARAYVCVREREREVAYIVALINKAFVSR